MPLPSTLPVSELIARNILTTVAGITTANGYSFNLTAQRHTRAGDKRLHLNAIVTQDDPREVADPKVYNTYEWTLPFHIGVFIVPLPNDTTAIDTYVNVIKADVEKALMVDLYRGGNALNTEIKPSITVSEEGLEYDLLVINVEVNYRTSAYDPYVNAK